MDNSDKPTCETCPYFFAPDNPADFGQCMVDPPGRATRDSSIRSYGWCREHPDMPAWIKARADA